MSDLLKRDNVWETTHPPIEYTKPEALSFIYDHLGNQRLVHPQKQAEIKNVTDKSFHKNEEFWTEILNTTRYYNYRNVVLEGFQITDWFPRSPGLTYTLDAARSRENAKKHFEPGSRSVYTPMGKDYEIKGGVGSYRFNPFEYEGTKYCLCTATSDGFCHTGIPLAIPLEWMGKIDFSAAYKITGKYQHIDNSIDKHFTHMSGLPKFYFLIEDLVEDRTVSTRSLVVTPVVFMHGKDGERLASYCTCYPDNPRDVDATSAWLQDYADRYDAKIVTDYDQQRPAFANVPFSLQNVMAGNVLLQQLLDFGFSQKDAEKLIIQINITGNFQGNLIVGNNNQINPKQ